MQKPASVFLLTCCLLSAPIFIHAQHTKKARQGMEAYLPTKLEWASLEMQASYGQNTMTKDSPLMVSFMDSGDGYTIKCIIQYTSDYPAVAMKATKDAIDYSFKRYKEGKGWGWLMLSYDEHPLKGQWPN